MIWNTFMLTVICIYAFVCDEINIAPMATLNASSTSKWYGNDYAISNAIDGEEKGRIDTCGCCFSSEYEDMPSFEAYLKGKYLIERIVVIGRQDTTFYYNDLSNITIHLDNTKADFTKEVFNTVLIFPLTQTVHRIKIQKNRTTDRKAFLIICEIKIYATVVNAAKYASLSVSSTVTYGPWNYEKENAIDGITDDGENDANNCGCCYSSSKETRPFFKATFQEPFYVSSIFVAGTKTHEDPLISLKIFLDGISTNVTEVRSNNTVYVIPNTNVQTIKVVKEGGEVFLFICEIRVFVPACYPGFYGHNCTKQCDVGYCKTPGKCDVINGNCLDGCESGHQGDTCKKPCVDGKFGRNCSNSCNCFDHDVCNKTTGFCPRGCSAGFSGINCSEECKSNTFGRDCISTCNCINDSPCDDRNGTCGLKECSPGWLGDTCNIKCPVGTFGFKCNHVCGSCQENTTCDHVSGVCHSGCAPGYAGSVCMEFIIEKCEHNRFGEDCKYTCHCINDSPCDNIDGTCYLDECSPGWFGDACDKVCVPGTFGLKCKLSCGSCKNNRTCDHVSGVCREGCDPKYTGLGCTEYTTGSKTKKSVIGVALGITIAIIVCLIGVIVFLLVRRKIKPRQATETHETYEKPNVYITPSESSDYATIQSGNNFEMATIDPV